MEAQLLWMGLGQCGQSALEPRDVWSISVPSINNPAFSNAGLAAGCFHHSQTPPPTQAKASAKGTLEGEEEVPSTGHCPKALEWFH